MNLFDVYPIYDIEPVTASGSRFTDSNGEEYLDFYGGHAVISIGHSHPHYIARVSNQLRQLGFYSNSIINPLQQELADKLGSVCGYPDYQLFLVNSGTEANENALKLASFITGKKGVISFRNGFHGRTAASVAVTDNPRIRAAINPCDHVSFFSLEDLNGVDEVLMKNETCAIIIEGIQGIAGINTPSREFLMGLRDLCNKYEVVLILDEVQSGYGRSGAFFAHQHSGIEADLITMAKGMGNGFPIGGLLISPSFESKHGQLGTTFGGNHLACSAALAVLEVIEDEKLIENARLMGNLLCEKLKAINQLVEVRGQGLMLGMKFDFNIKKLRHHLLFTEKVFVGSSSDPSVLRLLPPLCIGINEVDQFINCLTNSLKHEELLVD
ncbi:MAG: acetylornithine aminotransferase [Cyclobacteriaceae bacterium]|nr:MAG: acetylornithine aminotransferase [Cyclobacteriaceae bacterium]